MQERARDLNKKAQKERKERHDGRSITKKFQPADSVLLRIHLHKRGTCPKLADKFAGPYTVLVQVSEVNYRVMDQKTGKQQTVHVNRMKIFPERSLQEEPCSTQEKLSEEQYDEIFGDSDSEEEFYGFEDVSISDKEEIDEEATYTIYHITFTPLHDGSSDNGIA